MKLVWKLFCSMVILTSLSCSMGGFFLIDTQFNLSFNREVDALYEENGLMRYALLKEIDAARAQTFDDLHTLAAALSVNTNQKTAEFRISDPQGNLVGSHGTLPADALPLLEQLDRQSRGWRLLRQGDGQVWLHAASPFSFSGETLFLESCREVTETFTIRSEQYRAFVYLMLCMIAVIGLLSLGAASLLLRPLGRLSAAARQIAEGRLDVRVPVTSTDELGRLSEDFNRMAARLETQVHELTDAKRRQDNFVSSFAHELKTPLTSIIGYADLLRSRTVSQEETRAHAGWIFSEGRRLEALGRKLMDLLVLDRQDFPMHAVPMEAFLPKIAEGVRPALTQAGIRLEVQADAASIPVDADLMETVLLNLLDNARKAIDGSGEIRLEGLSRKNSYRIRVTDSGKGIPLEELSHITEAFYMVDKSRARAQGGAGLGLALCQRILAMHGGTMEFQSVVGHGTTVQITLTGGGAS